MAEDNEDRNTDDLSEEASPYRLEEFRRKGQVAQSRELAALGVLLASGIALFALAPAVGKELAFYMKEVFSTGLALKPGTVTESWAGEKLLQVLKVIAMVGFPIALAGFVLGVVGHIAQIGFLISTDPLEPNLDKINPLNGLKKMFSMQQVWETFRVVLKGIAVIWAAYTIVKSEILQAPVHIFTKPSALLANLGDTGRTLFLVMCGILVLFAGVDYFLQKREFGKKVRVTKQEAKQEMKEQEGDPLIKARIRSIQRDQARKRMMQAVKKADVVITNPTHIAIALVYDKNKMNAPKVVAKGADFVAQKIKKIAAEAGVPLVENVPLARALYKSVKLNHSVPKNLFQAVAEVLAYVYRLKGTAGQWKRSYDEERNRGPNP